MKKAIFSILFALLLFPLYAESQVLLQQIRSDYEKKKITKDEYEEKRNFLLKIQNSEAIQTFPEPQTLKEYIKDSILILKIERKTESPNNQEYLIKGLANNTDNVFDFLKKIQGSLNCMADLRSTEEIPLNETKFYARFSLDVKFFGNYGIKKNGQGENGTSPMVIEIFGRAPTSNEILEFYRDLERSGLFTSLSRRSTEETRDLNNKAIFKFHFSGLKK